MEKRLTAEQNIEFYGLLLRLHDKYKIRVCIDCSSVPMLSSRRIHLKALEFFSVTGCDGGNILIGIDPEGKINACSFCEEHAGSIFDLEGLWDNSPEFSKFRDWTKTAPEPCKSCRYLDICRGGCHIVAQFLTGDFNSPDPECPTVVRHQNQKA